MVWAGLALPAVMQSGGWRSPEMVGRYTGRLEALRGGAAQLADLQKRERSKPTAGGAGYSAKGSKRL